MDYSIYEPHIDFIYTTLLMIWGGSCIGIGFLAIPYIFKHMDSNTEASQLTTRILKRQDILIRIIALSMIAVFYFKSKLSYSYQHMEWASYVAVLHFYIFGKVISRRLWKMRDKIETFDTPSAGDRQRVRFHRLHIVGRLLYTGQVLGVIVLLYLHAFGLGSS